MNNPWEEIALEDYENHMRLDSVMQLQAMNEMMKGQLNAYTATTVMILGVAGGNGLEHVSKDKYEKVYGVDVNADYLQAASLRYPELNGILECLCINLAEEPDKLPKADMVIANLLVEYIGYPCFQKVIVQAEPRFVSCIIQINMEDGWVSDSPYLHVFDRLEQVHHQMDEKELERAMQEVGYQKVKTLEYPLPNGKKLVQLDFSTVTAGGEIWDGYYRDETLANVDLVRGELIPDGLYHLVCEVLVQHMDGDYLLMRRDVSKPNYGGCYEGTAGGSALKGEGKEACAKRELFEETGISSECFTEIGHCVSDERKTIYYAFLCVTDCDKNAVTLQTGETMAYKWVSEADFVSFVNSGEMIESQKERYAKYFLEKGYIG